MVTVTVLGPAGGKTTGQARLSTFFENIGWKVGFIALDQIAGNVQMFLIK